MTPTLRAIFCYLKASVSPWVGGTSLLLRELLGSCCADMLRQLSQLYLPFNIAWSLLSSLIAWYLPSADQVSLCIGSAQFQDSTARNASHTLLAKLANLATLDRGGRNHGPGSLQLLFKR